MTHNQPGNDCPPGHRRQSPADKNRSPRNHSYRGGGENQLPRLLSLLISVHFPPPVRTVKDISKRMGVPFTARQSVQIGLQSLLLFLSYLSLRFGLSVLVHAPRNCRSHTRVHLQPLGVLHQKVLRLQCVLALILCRLAQLSPLVGKA